MKIKYKSLRDSGVDFKKVLLELDKETRELLEVAVELHTDTYEALDVKHAPTQPYIINMALKALLDRPHK